jgi:acetate kinase
MGYLLALNCGSSSLKYKLYSYPALEQVSGGKATEIGTDKAGLQLYFGPSNKKEQVKLDSRVKHFEVRQTCLRNRAC